MSATKILLLGVPLLLAALFFTSCKSDYQASTRQGKPGEAKPTRQVKIVAVAETLSVRRLRTGHLLLRPKQVR